MRYKKNDTGISRYTGQKIPVADIPDPVVAALACVQHMANG
jgi:hypothetical protein